MNILFLSIEFNYCCGISRSILSLAKELKKRGHHVVLGVPGGTMIDECLEEGFDYFFFPLYPDKKTAQDAWTCIRAIKKAVKKYNVDIVHSHHRLAEFFALAAGLLHKTPTVSTAHALISGKKHLSFRSDKIIAVSETVRKMLVNDFNISHQKIDVIRNIPRVLRTPSASEQDDFKQSNHISENDFIVAGIGRLHHEKGFDLLLKALNNIKHLANVRVFIAGKGVEEIVLQQYSEKHNLNVTFLGEIENVELIYSVADIIVIPSRQESAGLVAVEAGFFRKPVIATGAGGLKETITDGFSGLLVPAEDDDAISKAIEQLYNDVKLSEELGSRLFAQVNKEYNTNNIVQQTHSLYLQLNLLNGVSKNS